MNIIQLKKKEIPLPELPKDIPLEKSPEVKQLVFNLVLGKAFEFQPSVKPDDKVKAGDVIAKSENGFSIIAPVSGTVIKIEERYSSFGDKTPAIVLEAEGKPKDSSTSQKTPKDAKSIIDLLFSKGVFIPWTVTNGRNAGNGIKHLIINGVDEDPGFVNNKMILKNDHVIVEKSIEFLKILAPEAKMTLAVGEDDHKRLNDIFGKYLNVLPVGYKYLDRLEHNIVNRVFGKKRPAWKNYHEDGIAVISVEQVMALYNSITGGMPNVKRRITVDGDVLGKPRYIEIYYGTPIRDILDSLGVTVQDNDRITIGGPIKGLPQFDLDVPLNIFSNGLYIQRDNKKSFTENYPCTNCGFCTRACPEHLQVHLITRNSEFGFFEKAVTIGADCCILCGMCSYVCPAHRPLVQYIKFALDEAIMEKENEVK